MGFIVWLSTTKQPVPEYTYDVEEIVIEEEAEDYSTGDPVVFEDQHLTRITVQDSYGNTRDVLLTDSTVTVPAGFIAVPGKPGQLIISVEEL